MRAAKTLDEKMLIYSELVKANGAQMLGGQVGITSKSWDLELKGDENFPGPAGRARLNQQRKALADRLKPRPPKADEVVRQSGEVLARCRSAAPRVADRKRYTESSRRPPKAAAHPDRRAHRRVPRRPPERPRPGDAQARRRGVANGGSAYTRLQARVSASEVSIASCARRSDDVEGARRRHRSEGLDRGQGRPGPGAPRSRIAAAETWIATERAPTRARRRSTRRSTSSARSGPGDVGQGTVTAVTALGRCSTNASSSCTR